MKIRNFAFLFAALSGILTALAFPKFNLSFFSWISLIPLLFLIIHKTPKESFRLGFTAGIFFYGILLYWIPAVPAHYGNLSLGLSLVIYFLLICFLALFWAFPSSILSKLYPAFPRFVLFLFPFVWIAFEYILTHLLTGFPWGLLGTSQFKNIFFIQAASVTGIYGLSFLIVFFQSMFVFSMLFRKKSPFFLGLGFLIIVHLGGALILKETDSREKSFRASVIQGNVSSDIYWHETSSEDIMELFEHHLELSRKAHLQGAELVIWPEFSVPLCFSCPQGLYLHFKERLFAFVKETNITLLLGTNERADTPEENYHNTALCLRPDLTLTRYHKMHLVPFGEYTPYKRVFSFIERLTHAIGEVTPGNEYVLHGFDGTKFGSLICYEIIFPNLVRTFVKNGADFLVTITNDGWYGKSSAPYQHFAIAVIRAVENRRYLLRAATTGISGIIDPRGRILQQTELMTSTFLVSDIVPSKTMTPYARFGDFLPVSGLTLSAIFFILALIKRRHEKQRNRFKSKLS